jgi:hypothetical protein
MRPENQDRDRQKAAKKTKGRFALALSTSFTSVPSVAGANLRPARIRVIDPGHTRLARRTCSPWRRLRRVQGLAPWYVTFAATKSATRRSLCSPRTGGSAARSRGTKGSLRVRCGGRLVAASMMLQGASPWSQPRFSSKNRLKAGLRTFVVPPSRKSRRLAAACQAASSDACHEGPAPIYTTPAWVKRS